MSNRTYETADARISAYVEMLKTVYQVDEYGLADMLGIPRSTWTEERKAALGDKSWDFVTKLAKVTKISIDWLADFDSWARQRRAEFGLGD